MAIISHKPSPNQPSRTFSTQVLTPAQYEAKATAARASEAHAARREAHLRLLFAPPPLEEWAQERIASYWRELRKGEHHARKTA